MYVSRQGSLGTGRAEVRFVCAHCLNLFLDNEEEAQISHQYTGRQVCTAQAQAWTPFQATPASPDSTASRSHAGSSFPASVQSTVQSTGAAQLTGTCAASSAESGHEAGDLSGSQASKEWPAPRLEEAAAGQQKAEDNGYKATSPGSC